MVEINFVFFQMTSDIIMIYSIYFLCRYLNENYKRSKESYIVKLGSYFILSKSENMLLHICRKFSLFRC